MSQVIDPSNELITLFNSSVKFTQGLIEQLNRLDEFETLSELYHGRSLIQEIYNEFNYQIYTLQALPPLDEFQAKINEIATYARMLEASSKIPWDGSRLLSRGT